MKQKNCITQTICRLLYALAALVLSSASLSAGFHVILDAPIPDGTHFDPKDGLTLNDGIVSAEAGGTTSAQSHLGQVKVGGETPELAELGPAIRGLLPGDILRFSAEIKFNRDQGGLTRSGTQINAELRFMADHNSDGVPSQTERGYAIKSDANTNVKITIFPESNYNTSDFQYILTEMHIPEFDQNGDPIALVEWAIRLPSNNGDVPDLEIRNVKITAENAGVINLLDVAAPQGGVHLDAQGGLTLNAGSSESTISTQTGGTTSEQSHLSQVGLAKTLDELGLSPGDVLEFTADIQMSGNGGLSRLGTQISTQFRLMADYDKDRLVDTGSNSEYANRIESSATTSIFPENYNETGYQTIETVMVIPEFDLTGEPISLIEWSIRFPSELDDTPSIKIRNVRITADIARTPKQFYVATDGTDAGSGTLDNPFRTIQYGISNVDLGAGDTLFIRGGTYREQVLTNNKSGTEGSPITISGYQSEEVIISGADVVDSWQYQLTTPIGKPFWKTTWTHDLSDSGSEYIAGQVAQQTEMVIFNGQVLKSVETMQELEGFGQSGNLQRGTYWIEFQSGSNIPSAIYARFPGNQSPTSAENLVECAVRVHAIDASGSSWLVFKNLTARHCASPGTIGAINVAPGSQNIRFEDIISEWNNAAGFRARGNDDSLGKPENHSWIRCQARDNGQIGFLIVGNEHLLEDCTTVRNNWKNFENGHEAGGLKAAVCNYLVIRRMVSADNNGVGIWLDIDNNDCLVEHCVVYDNWASGIMLELRTSRTTCRNNIIWGNKAVVTNLGSNGGRGIYILAASDNYVYHNTLFDHFRSITVNTDGRETSSNNYFYNNILEHPIYTDSDSNGTNEGGNLIVSTPADLDDLLGRDWHLDSPLPPGDKGVVLPSGIPRVGLSVDFDGQTRNRDGASDAGADEYNDAMSHFPGAFIKYDAWQSYASDTTGGSSFDFWAAGHFTETELNNSPIRVEAFSDFDEDQLPNCIEVFLGRDPREYDVEPPFKVSVDGERITFSYEKSHDASDLTSSFQWSPDLSTWDTAELGTTVSPVSNSSHSNVTVELPKSGRDRAFGRLEVNVGTPLPIGSEISLQSAGNLHFDTTRRFVSIADNRDNYLSNQDLYCNRGSAFTIPGGGSFEPVDDGLFTVVDAGAGKIALLGNNGKYINARDYGLPGPAPAMTCDSDFLGADEKFTVNHIGPNLITLQGNNDHYVSSNGGNSPMTCDRDIVSAWEKFVWKVVVDAPAP